MNSIFMVGLEYGKGNKNSKKYLIILDINNIIRYG